MVFIILAGDKDNKDNKMYVYMSRKITILTLFLWLMTVTFPVIAQQKAAQQNHLTDMPLGTKTPTGYHFSLRSNLLRWATLTPDLGVEWRICPSWGIAVNGSWTSWSWNAGD